MQKGVQYYKREFLDQKVCQADLSRIHAETITHVINQYTINAIIEVQLSPSTLQLKNVGCLENSRSFWPTYVQEGGQRRSSNIT